MTKKKVFIICTAVCAFVIIALCLSAYAWASTFDGSWVLGKSKEKIEHRYGVADVHKGEYIEYWTKDGIGCKVNRVFFDSNEVASHIEYDYTNTDGKSDNSRPNTY